MAQRKSATRVNCRVCDSVVLFGFFLKLEGFPAPAAAVVVGASLRQGSDLMTRIFAFFALVAVSIPTCLPHVLSSSSFNMLPLSHTACLGAHVGHVGINSVLRRNLGYSELRRGIDFAIQRVQRQPGHVRGGRWFHVAAVCCSPGGDGGSRHRRQHQRFVLPWPPRRADYFSNCTRHQPRFFQDGGSTTFWHQYLVGKCVLG